MRAIPYPNPISKILKYIELNTFISLLHKINIHILANINNNNFYEIYFNKYINI